jgi:catechol-2,3-dioxygenase
VAFKIGSSAEELALAKGMLRDSRTPVLYEAGRGFARSVHVLDPDGNEIELYVDTADP